MNQTAQNTREYTPDIYIDKGYVEFLKDSWVKTEFIYRGDNLVSIHLYTLLCDPLKDKPSFKLINLSDETYLETYFPFIEIKHVIPIRHYFDFKDKPHEATITKYIKCNRYKKDRPYTTSDLICTINPNQMGLHYKLINTKEFNKTASGYDQELEADNHYKFSYSYYKSEYYETSKSYTSTLSINRNQFIVRIHNSLNPEDSSKFVVYYPILYTMNLDFELYKQLTD